MVEAGAPLRGDEYLYCLACNDDCYEVASWSRQEVERLDIADNTPGLLQFDSSGRPYIVASYRVIASNSSRLRYYGCIGECKSLTPLWREGLELKTLTEDSFDPNAYSLAVTDTEKERDMNVVTLIVKQSCTADCLEAQNWAAKSVADSLPVELKDLAFVYILVQAQRDLLTCYQMRLVLSWSHTGVVVRDQLK